MKLKKILFEKHIDISVPQEEAEKILRFVSKDKRENIKHCETEKSFWFERYSQKSYRVYRMLRRPLAGYPTVSDCGFDPMYYFIMNRKNKKLPCPAGHGSFLF